MIQHSFDIYKLYFRTPLHISKGKLNTYESSDDRLHSDTLKSALFVCLLQLYGETEANVFMDSVKLSSAFPFDDKHYWLPRPLSFSFAQLETPDNRKALKKIQYFTLGQYAEILRGGLPTLEYDANQKANQPNIWIREVTQRVKINYDDDSEPFYLEKLYPAQKNAGLFFIFTGDYDKDKLNAAVRLLGDNGIGLQKGLGNGQFEAVSTTISLQLPKDASSWVSLSLYRPENKAEIENGLEQSHYQFLKRGGWIASPQFDEHLSVRKQAVMMFTEGSVFEFETTNQPYLIKGIKENVRPIWNDERLHDVHRDGKAIFLPIKN
jgi:CRISPR-associated protein Csm4